MVPYSTAFWMELCPGGNTGTSHKRNKSRWVNPTFKWSWIIRLSDRRRVRVGRICSYHDFRYHSDIYFDAAKKIFKKTFNINWSMNRVCQRFSTAGDSIFQKYIKYFRWLFHSGEFRKTCGRHFFPAMGNARIFPEFQNVYFS